MYILSSKVTRPAPPSQILDRPRLYARLDQWQTTPVVFVHAPAGYGKSMLVCRWLEIRGLASHAAWLSLDPGDDDPQQFVRYLAAALEAIVPGIAAAVHLLLDAPEPDPMRALELLLSKLQRDPKASDNDPLLLVLDDLHQIDSPTLAPLMTLFLERRPVAIARFTPRAPGHLWTADPALRGRAGVGHERGRPTLSAPRDGGLPGATRLCDPHARDAGAVGCAQRRLDRRFAVDDRERRQTHATSTNSWPLPRASTVGWLNT